MSLSTTQYGYIVDPMVPFTDASGTTIRNGYVRVFVAGSSTPVITYKNYDGATNEETIQLDNSGRTAYPVIVSKGNTYKVCVYDAEHSQESPILTIDKVVPAGANVEATNIVTGLDNVESPEAGWVKSTVSGTDAEVSLDATNVTSEVDTMVKATAASADYMMPLVHKTGSDPDKKITLGNIFKFVLNFIHSLTDTATEADLVAGNYLAIDGSAGTKKLAGDTIAKRSSTIKTCLVPVNMDGAGSAVSTTYETGVLKTDGTVQVVSGFYSSDFVAVEPTKQYFFKAESISASFAQICLYDSSKNLIGHLNESVSGLVGVAFGPEVSYFRITARVTNGLFERICTSPIFYKGFPYYSLQLFDKTKSTDNVYINSDGGETSFNGARASDFIPVVPGATYSLVRMFGGTAARTAFYTLSKDFISSQPSSATTVTAPANAGFMRISYIKTYENEVIVNTGTSPLPLVTPFGAPSFDIYNQWLAHCPYVAKKSLDINQGVSFVDGIFDENSSSSFKTSDYINIAESGSMKSELFLVLGNNYGSSFSLVKFYDAAKNVIGVIKGNELSARIVYKILAPKNAVYMKFSQAAGNIANFGFGKIKKGETFDLMKNECFAANNNLIWIGTSIPRTSQYPIEASRACGYNCINQSLGESKLCFDNVHPAVVTGYSGKCLTATVAELEAMYRQDVTNNVITEETLDGWKDYSYERSIIPYIDGTDDTQVAAVVLDHGFNDRAVIHSMMANPSSIDWTSTDRSNFVGAFNYLMKKILEASPFCRIVISGYFQNIYGSYYSKDICDMQELIAEKYDLPLLPAWKYSGINFEYVPGSSSYISNYNSTYGTSYTKMDPDFSGNIPLFQFFCPDKVHPGNDRTGNSDRRLNAVYTKLLKDIL